MGKEDLKRIRIETSEEGFSIWITERKKGGNVTHWLLDGSTLLEDGSINMGNNSCGYRFEAVYEPTTNDILFIDRKNDKSRKRKINGKENESETQRIIAQ